MPRKKLVPLPDPVLVRLFSRPPSTGLGRALESFSRHVTRWTGSSWAFAMAVAVVLIWLATGPLFHYSDTWQLVINTGTTIVTFLMVFLIQRSQNKDAQAVHLKLNEIVAAIEGASNRLVDVEDLSEDELGALHAYYRALSDLAKRDIKVTQSHSIEEAVAGHAHKQRSSARHGKARAKPKE